MGRCWISCGEIRYRLARTRILIDVLNYYHIYGVVVLHFSFASYAKSSYLPASLGYHCYGGAYVICNMCSNQNPRWSQNIMHSGMFTHRSSDCYVMSPPNNSAKKHANGSWTFNGCFIGVMNRARNSARCAIVCIEISSIRYIVSQDMGYTNLGKHSIPSSIRYDIRFRNTKTSNRNDFDSRYQVRRHFSHIAQIIDPHSMI